MPTEIEDDGRIAAESVPVSQALRICYHNHKQQTRFYSILPERIWFGTTQWYPEPQWLMDAMDLTRNERRSFALSGIRLWNVPL